MPTLYRVEYTPPVPPSQAWTKSNVIVVVFVTDAQFAELGFDNKDICSVEWRERPDLFVELWRQEEDAIKATLSLLNWVSFMAQRRAENIIQVAQEEDRPFWDKDKPPLTQSKLESVLQILQEEERVYRAEKQQKPPA